MMMAIGLSPAMALLRERTGTVVSAAVFHGTFNAVATLSIVFLSGLLAGVTGLAGLCALVVLNAGVLWVQRTRIATNSL